MKKFIHLILFLLAFPLVGTSQCFVTLTPLDTTTVCPGDTVFIEATAALLGAGQSFDFNSGTLPPGWSAAGGTSFSTPCGASLTGDPYFWASTVVSGVPNVETAAFDITCGGFIIFDMKFAVQGGPVPCEGPDLITEGVELQYSTNGGLTWFPIIYYNPNGTTSPSQATATGAGISGPTIYTVWETYTVPIPPAALTTSTMFRWFQVASSGSCCDNWGLDNIVINATGPPCGNQSVVNWSNGLMDTTTFYTIPTSDTMFIAYVSDTLGNYQAGCTDTLWINIAVNDLTYDLLDTTYAYCPTAITPVDVTNIVGGTSPIIFDWSTGSITSNTDLPTNGNEQDTINYYVDIEDACGYMYEDTVVLVVNQTLYIDSLTESVSAACLATGEVMAYVSGQTAPTTYLWEDTLAHINDPLGQTVPTVQWTNIGSGWYYFTVTDAYCTDMDSVFVTSENPPLSIISASTYSGCAPLTVTFANNSENTVSYVWDFGGGNIVNASDMSSQTWTFTETTVVTLSAYTTQNCGSTNFVTIEVIPCGCTNPLALNYNPIATIEDGTCIYPDPIVIAPNVFTPNADGLNDFFEFDLQFVSNIDVLVTNRWGNLMFEQSGVDPKWTGFSPGGSRANDGTYFYTYTATGFDGITQISGHGFVQLVAK